MDNCPPKIKIELDIEDRKIDNNIYIQLEKISLVQNQTEKYNNIFIDKDIYISPNIKIPNELLNQVKLYQLVIKDIIDSKQYTIVDKIDLIILEKIFGQVSKYENNNIVSYFKSALINEIEKIR